MPHGAEIVMETVFQSVTDSYASQFESLRLHIIEKSDLSTIFSDGRHSVEIERDHLDLLSLKITIIDSDGIARPIALLQDSLDPQCANEYRRSQAELAEKYSLRRKTRSELMKDLNRSVYLDYAIGMAFKFIAAHFHDMFDMTLDARAKYETAAKAAAKKWGLPFDVEIARWILGVTAVTAGATTGSDLAAADGTAAFSSGYIDSDFLYR